LQFSDAFMVQAVTKTMSYPFPNRVLAYDLGASAEDVIWCNLRSTLYASLCPIHGLGPGLDRAYSVHRRFVIPQLPCTTDSMAWLGQQSPSVACWVTPRSIALDRLVNFNAHILLLEF
jgi:hypothetical protein